MKINESGNFKEKYLNKKYIISILPMLILMAAPYLYCLLFLTICYCCHQVCMASVRSGRREKRK